MFDRRQFIATGACAAATFSLGLAPVAAETIRNVDFGPNRLDIYTPGTGNAPVLVYVHGGAWRAGSKGSVFSMPRYFNGQGYVFASIGYSLLSSVDRQAREVAAGINWIGANIAKYGGDPARIAATGHSAGCHLGSLAVLSGLASGVRAFVANDTGAYDIAYLAEINNGRLPLLYRALNKRDQWANWSPISYAGGGGQIPFLVAWSGGTNRDRISKRFADRLESAGHPVTRFDGSRYSHISIRSALGKPGEPLTGAVTDFLARNV